MKKEQIKSIPTELKKVNQWVVWRYEDRGGDKPTKIPYSVATGQPASSTDPQDWCSFEEAVSAIDEENYSGIGFVFTESDSLMGIDIDNCRDPETGEIDPQAQQIMESINSYTEKSPSDTGYKITLFGSKSENTRCRKKLNDGVEIEVYDNARYFTVTGRHLDGTPQELREAPQSYKKLEQQHLLRDKSNTSKTKPTGASGATGAMLSESDKQLIKEIRKSDDGITFARLFDLGDLSQNDGDHSEADFQLMCILGKHSRCNKQQMKRLFGQSALGNRPKWTERQDYRERTIDNAIREVQSADEGQRFYEKLKGI